MKKPKLIVITGPTASGKSALAVNLAKKLNTEIISADSRQIYQGIPIVTAVPTMEEQDGITHHLLEVLPLDGYYSASLFRDDTLKILQKIYENNSTAIVCGGSMLYIDALVNGIDDLPTVPSSIRSNFMQQWKKEGDDWLLSQLKTLDEKYFNTIDHRNLKRVFHAVEVSVVAEAPYSSLLTSKKKKPEFPFDVLKFCLDGTREKLFERINNRVNDMMQRGLEEEAKSVYHLRHLNSLNTVGLKEMFSYFEGRLSKEESISRIQKNTRVYAKKQLTWHKRDKEISYLDFSDNIEFNMGKILKAMD